MNGRGEASVYDVLLNEAPAEQAVLDTGFSGLMLLPSGIEDDRAEVELVEVEKRENLLKRALELLKAEYDFLFIDCPPSLTLLTLNALTAAER